ncbi:hypothetical protein FHX15_005187 [Rhizobium sp. BK650]|uniref:hypothetical protein n=1 Tax=Rhizobium sp. BK650 TaxID=2586990 RepID=UPI0016085D38|nr:hypothetical protein [Rhizobium sp. BK650]MBB3659918.1 hypothetical protein [Rhizobium sp. BK650]
MRGTSHHPIDAAARIIVLTAWLPMVLPLSRPIFCIAFSALVSWTPLCPLARNPLENRHLTERFSKLVMIIALMGRAEA